MNTTDLEAKVITFIASKIEHVEASTVTIASTFEQLGLDSMDTVQLLFDAEENFGITFDGDEVKALRSVGDIVDYIKNHPPTATE
ncbi:MAG: acyl carrier protein [Nitrosomonas sp.]|nr:MAG: acyl carrier protein [Nitrosomonas sp.]